MKRSILAFALSLVTYLGFGQCGPYTLTTADSCDAIYITLSGASSAQQIIWERNGIPFDTIHRSPIGVTVGGGNYGSAANQLDHPTGVYVDRSGNIYVADALNNRIQKFPPGSTFGTNGVTVAGGNGQGGAANQLWAPNAIRLDSADNIYIADCGNNRIQKFPSGSTSATSGITVAGGNGSGPSPNQLNLPTDLFIDASGNIYVADGSNNRIQKFPVGSTSSTNGVTVAGGNGIGSAANQLYGPNSLYLDNSGNIYVADSYNNRIQKFPTGSSSSTNAITIAANLLIYPTSVYVDLSGNIFVATLGTGCIEKFPSGSTSTTTGIIVAGGRGFGNAADQFESPYSVYLDSFSNIYVADQSNNRIQKWPQLPTLGLVDTSIFVYIQSNCSAIVTDTSGCVVSSNIVSVNPISAYFMLQSSNTPHLWYAINQCNGIGLSYIWNWGDSTNSTGDTPSHTYAASGYYNICVSVTDSAGCTANYCDTNVYLFKDQSGQMVYINVVNQIPSGIHTINPDNLNINYYAGAVHFSESLQAPTELKLYDLSGRVVMQQDNFAGNTWNLNSGIAQGVYMIHLQSGAYSTAKKLMIMQ